LPAFQPLHQYPYLEQAVSISIQTMRPSPAMFTYMYEGFLTSKEAILYAESLRSWWPASVIPQP